MVSGGREHINLSTGKQMVNLQVTGEFSHESRRDLGVGGLASEAIGVEKFAQNYVKDRNFRKHMFQCSGKCKTKPNQTQI